MWKLDGPVTKHSQFRQRVYRLPNNTIELILGNDPQPAEWDLLADHDISQVTVVTDHVDPAPTPAGGA
jgi:hypothetical protein